MKVTEDAYRIAAVSHVSVAQDLIEEEQYPLAAYLSGLSVECMLRAYSHRINDVFDARHDLRLWYQKCKFDAIIPESRTEQISSALALVVAQWNNSQRYYSVELLRAEWKHAELDRGIRGNFVKERTRRMVDAAWEIVTLGEQQWKNSLRKSKNY